MKRLITVAQVLVLATVASAFAYGEYWDWNADRIIGDPTVTIVGDLSVTGGLTVSGSSVLDNIAIAWDNVSITGGSITGTEITLSSGSVPWSLVTSRPTINSVTVTGAVLDNASNYPTLNQNTTGTAAGLTAQYIDWNSGSGGASIANKPTLGELAALDNGAAIDIAGNAGTATALAANPSPCGAGEYVTDIAANGNLTCGTPAGSGTVSGPASATEDNVVTWGADNTAIKDSGYAFSALAKLASPTFTGTVTIPTPFTLGAVSVTATGDELNFVDGVTSAIQDQLDDKAPLVSPAFTTPSLGAATATTLDTGQGANELYDMDQNVQTTDNVIFNTVTAEVIGPCSPADNDCFVDVTNAGALADNQLGAGRLWFDNTADMMKVRNNDNTATREVFTSGAAHTLNFATSGTLTGGIMILDNVVSPTAAQVYGSWNTITTAGTVTLPAAAPGMSTCIATEGALEITVDLDGSDTFVLEGVTMDAGEAIINTTAEAAGDYICVIATSAVKWRVAGSKGTWTQATP